MIHRPVPGACAEAHIPRPARPLPEDVCRALRRARWEGSSGLSGR